ncbi:PREDICTED: rhomboid-like protein 14, mitochondrial [Nicotiana attenuata]|uniref:Rhomboid-like protein 14, mitochondrial n=1 Tax=Nicotiana attenuata TaxID=49451 RepID=A0A1J6IF38_NICAT|nr:PREDICTED: rhomboid-like protein 14, mitochondrial [Nicotiana attenuata]OIT03502.1 rhomboid-like protein 14, mitochondrial [Nicotiana attenuata]
MERGRGRWGSVSRGMLPLLALHTVSEYCRLERKPPVTAGLLAANTMIYLRPSFLDPLLPTISEVWFNPHLILKYKDLKRFFLSAFYHVNDSHLVYNMLSLLWKGIQLETSMGSAEFASTVAALVAMSQGITLLLAKSLLLFFDYERPYYKEYAVGFSGVLFAMKVILNAQSDDYTYVHGLLVPTRYAAWAELILIQMFVPGVSFLGHLGGILAGLLFLRLKASYSGANPLRNVIRGFTHALNWPLRFVKCLFRSQPRIAGRGTVGGRQTRDTSQTWRCEACTFDNSGWLSVCEMCGTSRTDDGLSSLSSTDEIEDLSLEELRRRRIQRFGR